MVFLLFLIFVCCLVLLGASGILGFILAVYLFRIKQIGPLLEDVAEAPDSALPLLRLALGAVLSVAIPLVAALSYAVSSSKLIADFFGPPSANFWIWVASAFAIGFVVGLLLRGDSAEQR